MSFLYHTDSYNEELRNTINVTRQDLKHFKKTEHCQNWTLPYLDIIHTINRLVCSLSVWLVKSYLIQEHCLWDCQWLTVIANLKADKNNNTDDDIDNMEITIPQIFFFKKKKTAELIEWLRIFILLLIFFSNKTKKAHQHGFFLTQFQMKHDCSKPSCPMKLTQFQYNHLPLTHSCYSIKYH